MKRIIQIKIPALQKDAEGNLRGGFAKISNANISLCGGSNSKCGNNDVCSDNGVCYDNKSSQDCSGNHSTDCSSKRSTPTPTPSSTPCPPTNTSLYSDFFSLF